MTSFNLDPLSPPPGHGADLFNDDDEGRASISPLVSIALLISAHWYRCHRQVPPTRPCHPRHHHHHHVILIPHRSRGGRVAPARPHRPPIRSRPQRSLPFRGGPRGRRPAGPAAAAKGT